MKEDNKAVYTIKITDDRTDEVVATFKTDEKPFEPKTKKQPEPYKESQWWNHLD